MIKLSSVASILFGIAWLSPPGPTNWLIGACGATELCCGGSHHYRARDPFATSNVLAARIASPLMPEEVR